MGSRLAVLFLVAGCHSEAPRPEAAKPPVKVVAVEPHSIQPRIAVAGVLAPLPGRDVKVGALVAGRIDRVLVAEGDAVKLGQALAHIEAEPLQQHVAETEAQKTQARAAVENARSRLERTEKLLRDGIASRQEVEDARAALVASESALKQAQAGGGIATVQLDRATLRAPIAGVVAAVLVPAGQPVDGSGAPVIEIADTRVLDLRAQVAASRIGGVTIGQRARLSVDGVGEIDGTVEAIAPLVDSATNTVVVRVRIDNAHGRLRGGLYARGAILGAARIGPTVPTSALLPGDGGAASTVAVVGADGKVSHRALLLGDEAGDEVEVRAGLVAGERVITAGGYALPDGTAVEILP